MKEFIIKNGQDGGRLDKFLFNYLNEASKSFVYKMLRKKNILLNDKKASGNEILKLNDSIKIYFSDETLNKFHSEINNPHGKTSYALSESDILYEDENIIALNKKPGLLSQKSKGDDISLNDLLIGYLLNKNDFFEDNPAFVPGISNRLDRNTSGIILAGKNQAASRELNKMIKERLLTKIYCCMVKGIIKDEFTLKGFLNKDYEKNVVRVSKVPSDDKSLEIETKYMPVCSNENFSFIDVDLITGRTHQIRAHLASCKHPIIGDPKYGDIKINAALKNKYNVKSQLLHSKKIIFNNPEGILKYLKGVEINAPLPDTFLNVLKGEKLWQPGTAEVSGESNSKN